MKATPRATRVKGKSTDAGCFRGGFHPGGGLGASPVRASGVFGLDVRVDAHRALGHEVRGRPKLLANAIGALLDAIAVVDEGRKCSDVGEQGSKYRRRKCVPT